MSDENKNTFKLQNIKSSFKKYLGLDNPEGAGVDDDFDLENDHGITEMEVKTQPKIKQKVEKPQKQQTKNDSKPNVMDNNNGNYQTIFIDPKDFNDCKKIADYVKNDKMVTLNLEYLDEKTAVRIMNFISGAMSIKGANYLSISKKVYTIIPNSMKVYYEGKKNISPKIFNNFGGEE